VVDLGTRIMIGRPEGEGGEKREGPSRALGFWRDRGSGVDILAATVAPDDEEGVDEVQNIMAEGW
jgi:hypothetical protein